MVTLTVRNSLNARRTRGAVLAVVPVVVTSVTTTAPDVNEALFNRAATLSGIGVVVALARGAASTGLSGAGWASSGRAWGALRGVDVLGRSGVRGRGGGLGDRGGGGAGDGSGNRSGGSSGGSRRGGGRDGDVAVGLAALLTALTRVSLATPWVK